MLIFPHGHAIFSTLLRVDAIFFYNTILRILNGSPNITLHLEHDICFYQFFQS